MTSPVDATPLQFKPAKTKRTFEDVAEQIRAQLATGRHAAGQRLSTERELCEQFRVSRNTLREALRSLENAGLLTTKKGAGGGTYVAQASAGPIIAGLQNMMHLGSIEPAELFEARIWFESATIRAAAALVRPDELEAMAANVEQAVEAGMRGDYEARIRINIDFHRMIARATRNTVAIALMEALLQATYQVLQRVGPYDNGFVPAARKRFLKHLAARDGEAAAAEMERQLTRLQKIYTAILAKR
jgi:DNA-binding FadR family transcriptional regulator